MNKMNPVVHFEMPYEDRGRMVDFYSKTFGWEAQLLGPEMGDYAVVHTGETDENQMLKKPGMINGGLFKKTSDNQYPSLVIEVDDIHTAIQKVKDAGGKIIDMETHGEPMTIPGIGLYIGFFDTEGNRVSLLQPISQN